MKKSIGVLAVLALASPWMAAAQTPTAEAQIAEAVSILPDDLRAGATVVTYDATTGERKVLRQGTNFLECQPKMADGFERCYQQVVRAAPRSRGEAHAPQKKSEKEVSEAIAAAREGRHPAAGAAGDDVLPRLRQARSHPEPVGVVDSPTRRRSRSASRPPASARTRSRATGCRG